ncbi:MAG TPA: hypothetical protein VNW99_00165 [Cytophagaceae bacterium]|jgi:hypothetical protein|nr:hypothetical protein [Cytophagaceae bacterium]
MNGKLIFQLSLFGLAMGIATVYFIPSDIEPLCWLVIFIVCAYLIAKNCTEKYFLNGLCVCLLNSVWITAAHIILFNTYLANHPQEAEMMAKMPMPDSPRLMMLMMGPIVGLTSGIILGLFAFVASKIVKKKY